MSEQQDVGRWASVLANDAQADGEFFYAVKTTGIYCRPSCRSRPPRSENVVFFESLTEAEQARVVTGVSDPRFPTVNE